MGGKSVAFTTTERACILRSCDIIKSTYLSQFLSTQGYIDTVRIRTVCHDGTTQGLYISVWSVSVFGSVFSKSYSFTILSCVRTYYVRGYRPQECVYL